MLFTKHVVWANEAPGLDVRLFGSFRGTALAETSGCDRPVTVLKHVLDIVGETEVVGLCERAFYIKNDRVVVHLSRAREAGADRVSLADASRLTRVVPQAGKAGKAG